MPKSVKNPQTDALETRVTALESRMNEAEAELQKCPHIHQDVDGLAAELLYQALMEGNEKGNK